MDDQLCNWISLRGCLLNGDQRESFISSLPSSIRPSQFDTASRTVLLPVLLVWLPLLLSSCWLHLFLAAERERERKRERERLELLSISLCTCCSLSLRILHFSFSLSPFLWPRNEKFLLQGHTIYSASCCLSFDKDTRCIRGITSICTQSLSHIRITSFLPVIGFLMPFRLLTRVKAEIVTRLHLSLCDCLSCGFLSLSLSLFLSVSFTLSLSLKAGASCSHLAWVKDSLKEVVILMYPCVDVKYLRATLYLK